MRLLIKFSVFSQSHSITFNASMELGNFFLEMVCY